MELLRRVIVRPYLKGKGPAFSLVTWDTGRIRGNKSVLAYRPVAIEHGKRREIFSGSDFCPSPLHAIDSDRAIGALMSFLCLRPGDIDREYFYGYTPEQLAFAREHAESLGAECDRRFQDNR